jgi:D-alanyl-D-alanine carboxypeptidase/D-alanyl-D-alanine-endopeptidase (penicillin-binding protein 4)
MKRNLMSIVSSLFMVMISFAQTVPQKLQSAYTAFEKDSQLKYATISLYVTDAQTGQVLIDKNSRKALAPASTLKVITAAAALDILGKDFTYKTDLGYDGDIKNGMLNGNIYVLGSGDPTLGSWRWTQTGDSEILKTWTNEIRKLNIQRIRGYLLTNTSGFAYKAIPDGWIWQDIGNYYGAGSYPINWKENQFDLLLRSEHKIGGLVEVFNKNGEAADYVNELKAAARGSGDNAYIYPDNSVSGTIPVGEKSFKISGASADPVNDLLLDFSFALMAADIQSEPRYGGYARHTFSNDASDLRFVKKFYTHYSPPLDSIIYWYLQKSVNLYGEAILKTLAFEKKGIHSTDSGIVVVKEFWKQKGIDPDAIGMVDGSGLSPQNRVTAHSMVEILKYARGRSWFPYYFNAFPLNNNMRMKSGTIRGVKGYCGYHKAQNGKEYIFAFLVNNYTGSPAALVNKMFRVLDVLK